MIKIRILSWGGLTSGRCTEEEGRLSERRRRRRTEAEVGKQRGHRAAGLGDRARAQAGRQAASRGVLPRASRKVQENESCLGPPVVPAGIDFHCVGLILDF